MDNIPEGDNGDQNKVGSLLVLCVLNDAHEMMPGTLRK